MPRTKLYRHVGLERYVLDGQFSAPEQNKLKQIPGIKWSNRIQALTLPINAESRKHLFMHFGKTQMIWPDEEYRLFILDRLVEELTLRGYSPKTVNNYRKIVSRFMDRMNKDPIDAGYEEIREYHLGLLQSGISRSYVNSSISSLKFLYQHVLKIDKHIDVIARPKKEHLLPKVLSTQEVKDILSVLDNEKHKTILYLIYSAGLRVSEAANLTIEDIDSERMMIRIKQSKGRKDRYVMLSETVLKQIRKYYKIYYPHQWLFESQDRTKPIHVRSIQNIFKAACKQAGIRKDVSVHVLRHSFATHLLENGTDIRFIQELLGHASTRTTEIYTHVSKRHISKIKSPIDDLL